MRELLAYVGICCKKQERHGQCRIQDTFLHDELNSIGSES